MRNVGKAPVVLCLEKSNLRLPLTERCPRLESADNCNRSGRLLFVLRVSSLNERPHVNIFWLVKHAVGKSGSKNTDDFEWLVVQRQRFAEHC
jgi:hypothetical protein